MTERTKLLECTLSYKSGGMVPRGVIMTRDHATISRRNRYHLIASLASAPLLSDHQSS